MASKKITELTHDEAKWYFREEKNYVNFDLPYYFSFSDLLTVASGATFGKSLEDICKKIDIKTHAKPEHHESVNYTVLGNKDGSYSWRPFQLIHPVLYIDLVNLITSESNWNILTNKFKDFSNGSVECISIPRVSEDTNSHKASQIVHWWKEMEQRSIKMALKYNYVFATDIVNCYASIYTHSIEWALAEGGREQVKKDRAANTRVSRVPSAKLGCEIDRKIRSMNSGQTNGIPQGSTLMDFIAEIVLGYGDLLLSEVLRKVIRDENYHILRYRDDYKIFVNNPVIGRQILKELNSVLYDLGMKMSPEKTSENDDVILSSIKNEKLERISIAPITQHYQKEALRIYQLSKKYPNSGLVTKELSLFHDRIAAVSYLKNTDIEVLVSIFCMIAINSPKLISWLSAILTKLLEIVKDESRKADLITLIHKKFKGVPNTSLIDIWLQRISAPLGLVFSYGDKLTEAALNKIPNSKIWNCEWLSDEFIQQINAPRISGLPEKIENKSIPAVISRSEVELFKLNYD